MNYYASAKRSTECLWAGFLARQVDSYQELDSLAPRFIGSLLPEPYKTSKLTMVECRPCFFLQIIYSTRTQNLTSLLNKKKNSSHTPCHQLHSEQMKSSLIRVHFPSGFTSGREEGQKGQISLKVVFYGAAPSCPYKNLKDQEKCSA